MSTTEVWKYVLRPDDYVTIDMPRGAEPLTVAVQGIAVCLWARVDPAHPKETRRFRIAGTGHALADDVGRWIGTFQLHAGALVFHVFEVSR